MRNQETREKQVLAEHVNPSVPPLYPRRFVTHSEEMTRLQDFRQLPSPRTLLLCYCFVSIVLDFYFKYNPARPLTHLLVGTSPVLELIVICAVLLDNEKIAFFTCLLDVALGVVCVLTLPVITTAENLTGQRLHIPFVATFSANFGIRIWSQEEWFYFNILLGFFSTFLILVFLILDLLKLMILAKMRRAAKINETPGDVGLLKF